MASGGSNYNQYPAPLAKYEEVAANRQLFMTTLEKLHSSMGTKFMIPIIGGRDLDLHKLFLEVTSRGGIEKILREKRWKDVTAAFNFPSTATNASFVLRKYYYSLLQHYERIYYFKAQAWNPSSTGISQSPNTTTPVPVHGFAKMSPSPVQLATSQPPRLNTIEFVSGAPLASSVGSPVIGVIDGKFESGYLVTVTIGKEKLKGVLYQAPPAPISQGPQTCSGFSSGKTDSTPTTSGLHRRRRRRKKSEIRKRDPSHPKPNRSGYNFFFAEQHARLKPLHPGKDREISRMIGELWNKLKDNERSVYQDKAMKDKERYMMEMESYRERLKANQVISDAVPIQQRFPDLDVNMVDVDVKDGTGRDSPETEDEDESGSSKCDSDEDDDPMADSDNEEYPAEGVGFKSGNVGASETTTAEGGFQVEFVKEDEKTCDESEGSLGAATHTAGDRKQSSPPEAQHLNSVPPTMT